MNHRRLLFIGVLALVFGGVSSLLVYKQLLAKVAPARAEVDVIVAANDIQVGAKIEDRDLKTVKYPPDDLPTHAFHTKTSIVGRGVVIPIPKGEFVLADNLAGDKTGGGLSSLIATGMRAVAVRVNDVTAVAGFVVPGTRVDVLVTGNATGSGEPWTITVLQNVAVLATGQKVERSAGGEPQSASVVTLQVSPEDAEKLALASQEARIQLVLRNPVDTNQEKPETIKRTMLFGDAVSKHPTKLIRTKQAPAEPTDPIRLEIDIIRGTQKETIHLKQ
jgi:pilus assembly protein CpaB